MTEQTRHIIQKLSNRAKAIADGRMPEEWDRKSVTYLNIFNAYFTEALHAEYVQQIAMAHSHGFIEGLSKKLTITQSLKAFYEEI